MTAAKTLALIALGYVVAIVGGVAAVAVNEMLIPDEVQQTSGGMVAFGDMVLFVLSAGILSLAPTFFLLRLCVRKAPRARVAALLVIAALGPAGWIMVRWMAASPAPVALPSIIGDLTGLFIAFVAIPRMIFGPVLIVIEGVTLFMINNGPARPLSGSGDVAGHRSAGHVRNAYDGREPSLLDARGSVKTRSPRRLPEYEYARASLAWPR